MLEAQIFGQELDSVYVYVRVAPKHNSEPTFIEVGSLPDYAPVSCYHEMELSILYQLPFTPYQ